MPSPLNTYIGASGVANAAFDFAPAANQLSTDFGGTVKAVVNTAIESLKTPEGQGYALGTIGLALLNPSPAGETSAVLKTADKVADVASDVAKAANKVDFVVTPDGIAVPKNQSVMREGFDNAGFPKTKTTQTSEKGVIHTVPTKNGKVDVRTMEGSSKHDKRAVITHPGTNSPKTPSGRATTNKKDNHIRQH